MRTSDATLLESARAGDASALESLLARYQAQVYRFAMQMCRDPDDARDVLQETLLAMARSIRAFRGASSVSTWLYTIARNFCIKKRRRDQPPLVERSRAPDADTKAEQVTDPTKNPEEALAGKQIEVAVQRAIAALDTKYREVLVLRDVCRLSHSSTGSFSQMFVMDAARLLGLGSARVGDGGGA